MVKKTKDQIQNYGFYIILIGIFLLSTKCNKTSILIQKSYCNFLVYEEQKKITLDHCQLYDGENAFFTWDFCSRKCCQTDIINKFPAITQESLSACDSSQYNSQKNILFLISKICIITSMTILIIVSLSIIRYRFLLCKKINILCTAQSSKLQQLQKLDQLTTKIQDIKWVRQEEVEYRLADQSNSCCVCLEGDCNTLLSCQHYYHAQCIAGWLDKKRSCPLCQKDRIGILKIYCKSCRTYYFSCEYTLILNQEWQGQAAKSQCKNCENKGQASRQQFIHQIIHSKTSLYEHH